MSDETITRILNEIAEAHGGMGYWNSLEALEADISANGFLFLAKRRPPLRGVRMRASTREPRFTFMDFPEPGQRAELVGDDEVRILDATGAVVRSRRNPRSAFRGLGHLLSWDDLDFIYFGGYATWNYLTAPFLLLRPEFRIEAAGPIMLNGEMLDRLRVTFPDGLPTHSRTQVFYFGRDRLLRRLDYTAEVVGSWAHAAHMCEDYKRFDRLLVPTRRRVYPLLFGNRPLPGPLLVSIDVHDVRPIRRD